MKKIVAIMICLCMLLHFGAIDASSYARMDYDKKETMLPETGKVRTPDKEAIDGFINAVKLKINIPSDYVQFSCDTGAVPIRLRWYTQNGEFTAINGSVEVTINENGTILSYYHYRYDRNNEYQRRLPKFTKIQGNQYARKFIYSMCPELVTQIDFQSGMKNCSIDFEGNYRFVFQRQYKNVSFNENGLSIVVNGRTGEVVEYNRNWKEGVVFPDPDKAMKQAQANDSYKSKIPLRLVYARTYGEVVDRTYLSYLPDQNDISSSIDAFSGDKVQESQTTNYYNEARNSIESARQQITGYARDINLSLEALDKLVKAEKLITLQEAEEMARKLTEAGIDDKCLLQRANYSVFDNTGVYLVRLEFMKSNTSIEKDGLSAEKRKELMYNGGGTENIVVSFNAKTSELSSINTYSYDRAEPGESEYDKNAMLSIVQGFLKKHKPEQYSQAKYYDRVLNDYVMKYRGLMPYENSFVFTRNVDGISFDDNMLIVCFNSVTGRISYFSEIWDSIKFVTKDKVISATDAMDRMLQTNPLRLKYAIEQSSGEVRLVYSVDPRIPVCINALNGKLISYTNDNEYVAPDKAEFKDLDKSAVKNQIVMLYDAGILKAQEYFKPKAPMLQKDWLYLINKIRGGYGSSAERGEMNQLELDSMYRYLIMEGVLTDDERNPDMAITREQAVKFMINAIGYKKLAALEGIFNCDFNDNNLIDPKLVGHVSIARGLKIIGMNTKAFKPKNTLTREDAAVMIYNYLTR